jgi:hypothetical protein
VIKAPIDIIDIIDHRSEYSTQRMLVIDRMPDFIYEKKGHRLLGHESGCFKFYAYEAPYRSSKAFAGAEFDIPMRGGGVIKASGQWWDVFLEEFRGLVYSCGINTIEGLSRCYVFIGGIHIDCEIVDTWLAANEPTNNYHKYNERHTDYGKHTIKSQWDREALK